MLILFLLSGFETTIMRRARRCVTYDLACSDSKAGRGEKALALLQEAIEAGYSDAAQIRGDTDLGDLSETDAFRPITDS